jgi:act minimal PKS chain-length factor (CLF/KS beta)
LENLWGKGSQYVSAYQFFAWFYAVNTGQISIRHAMRGTSGVLVSVSLASDYGIDLVIEQPRAGVLCTALAVARGYGGFNSAMVVQAAE